MKRCSSLKFLTLLIIVLFLCQFVGGCTEPVQEGVNLDTAINKTANYLLADGIGSDWEAIAIKAAGENVSDDYLAQLKDTIKNWNWGNYLVTDLERTILGVVAAGEDPRNFCEINLLEKLVQTEWDRVAKQGINAVIYGLMALDSCEYQVPEGARWNREDLIQYLIKNTTDGAWSLTENGMDPDITGAALVALAPYKDREEVRKVIDDAVTALSNNQLNSGGFSSAGVENAESCAQVIQGLVAIGIDPSEEKFRKDNGDLVTNFLSYALDNGAFEHVRESGSNETATIQALQALVALKKYDPNKKYSLIYKSANNNQKNNLKKVTVRIEGIESTIAEGATQADTALTAVKNILTAHGINYELAVSSMGEYLKSINDLSAGRFGGYDGWLFYVKRGDQLVEPQVGIGNFLLEEQDEVIVYYGDFPPKTLKMTNVSLTPAIPLANQSFSITFEAQYYDWESENIKSIPIGQARVNINGTSYETDENGRIYLSDLPAGEYEFVITKYNVDDVPSLVKDKGKFIIRNH